MAKAAKLLYLTHFLLELVLGAIKLRGTYSGFDMPAGADKFARHHGVTRPCSNPWLESTQACRAFTPLNPTR